MDFKNIFYKFIISPISARKNRQKSLPFWLIKNSTFGRCGLRVTSEAGELLRLAKASDDEFAFLALLVAF